MKCPNCGNEVSSNAMFCDACGSAIQPQMKIGKCPNCGNEIETGEMYCSNCGTKIDQYQEINEQFTNSDHSDDTENEYERETTSLYGFCSNCGAPLNEGELFCGKCGMRTDGIEYIQQDDEISEYKKKNNGPVIIMICIIIVLLLIAGTLTGYYIYTNKDYNDSNDEMPVHTDVVNQIATEQPIVSTPAIQTLAPSPTADILTDSDSGYLFNSDKEYITNEYLDTLSQKQVRLILNEMYARHGYIFNLDEYIQYFSSRPWYVPKYTSADQAESYFNDVEKYNKKIIVNYEISKGWR